MWAGSFADLDGDVPARAQYRFQCDTHFDFMFGLFHHVRCGGRHRFHGSSSSGSSASGSSSSGSSASGSSSSGSSASPSHASNAQTNALRGTLSGAVDPAGKLKLAVAGKPVVSLQSGRYKLTVVDRASSRSFVVRDSGHPAITVSGVSFVGTRSVTVDLKAGRWTYYTSAGAKSWAASSSLPERPLGALALALLLGLVAATGARAGFPSLYVAYNTADCTFKLTDDAGSGFTTITPGIYQVVITTSDPYGLFDQSGRTDLMACKGFVKFRLSGPGVSLYTTLDFGDAASELYTETFQANATYTMQDDTNVPGTRRTFTVGALGATSPTSTTPSKASPTSGCRSSYLSAGSSTPSSRARAS